jgi:iron complex transport system substrate-binding protein
MVGRALLVLAMLWTGLAQAAGVTDATGRTVEMPDHILRVLPAGPPAAVLLEALAPDLMVGWTSDLSHDARALLAPVAAGLLQVPRLTGAADVADKVAALKPDLILDYGTVSPRYVDLVRATQEKTGVPTILLDGTLAGIPKTFELLGTVLHREGRAARLSLIAQGMLASEQKVSGHRTVVYARGADGLVVAAPDTDVTAVFTQLGWTVLAPHGKGTFRPSTIQAIAALDPDMLVFSDPAMQQTLAKDEAWHALRAVREGHAYIAPSLPFGWVEEPPSINRLLGLAWLSGQDPATLATLFYATVYGHALTPAQRDTVLAGVRSP